MNFDKIKYYIIGLLLFMLSCNIYNFYIIDNYEDIDTKSIKAFNGLSLTISIMLIVLIYFHVSSAFKPTNYNYILPMILIGLICLFSALNFNYVNDNNKKLVKIFNTFNFVLTFILSSFITLNIIDNEDVNKTVDKTLFEIDSEYIGNSFKLNDDILMDDVLDDALNDAKLNLKTFNNNYNDLY